MYWQKRFERENPDKGLEEKILEIRLIHKDFGYRRMMGELRKQGYFVNKKRIQRIMQKLSIQVTSFTRKVANIVLTKGKLVKQLQIDCVDVLIQRYHIKRLLLTLQSLSIMMLMLKEE